MSLIQEAKITFQQFEKWIISFCLTCIFKMELVWEIPIFRDFTSLTLCKYVHRHMLHVYQLKTACTMWKEARWQRTKQNYLRHHPGALIHGTVQGASIHLAQHLDTERRVLVLLPKFYQVCLVSILQTVSPTSLVQPYFPWDDICTLPSSASVPCSRSYPTPLEGQWPFLKCRSDPAVPLWTTLYSVGNCVLLAPYIHLYHSISHNFDLFIGLLSLSSLRANFLRMSSVLNRKSTCFYNPEMKK